MNNIMSTGGLPYFDRLCEKLALLESSNETEQVEARRIERLLGKHVHLGYWRDPEEAIKSRNASYDDFVVATEAMASLHFEVAGIKNGQALLDVGCGFGGTIESINERYQNMNMVGLNIDPRQLARARQQVTPKATHGNKIDFVEGDACELPERFANKFDVVMAVECIFHFPSRLEFFRQAQRALKPGGILVLSDFVVPALKYPLLLSSTFFHAQDLKDTCGEAALPATGSHYKRLAKRAGLRPEKVVDITRNTLPNYELMQRMAVEFPKMEDKMRRVNGLLGKIAARGIYLYQLLSFRKP
jgi:SAM-dependent methyltransferase